MMNLSGWTSLQYALYHGHENVVQVLVDLGAENADINTKNKK